MLGLTAHTFSAKKATLMLPAQLHKVLKKEFESELNDNILSYWIKEVYDSQRKTFFGRITNNGTKYPEAALSAVFTTRIMWTFSSAYRLFPKPEYKKMVQKCIRETIAFNDNEETDSLLLWDTIKMNIRGYTIKYASSKTKSRNLLISSLERKINELDNEFMSTNDSTLLIKIDALKKELEAEVKYKTQGSIIRSRTQWYEEGEKSSKYFLNLEKRNYNNKRIIKLQLDDNSIITYPTPTS